MIDRPCGLKLAGRSGGGPAPPGARTARAAWRCGRRTRAGCRARASRRRTSCAATRRAHSGMCARRARSLGRRPRAAGACSSSHADELAAERLGGVVEGAASRAARPAATPIEHDAGRARRGARWALPSSMLADLGPPQVQLQVVLPRVAEAAEELDAVLGGDALGVAGGGLGHRRGQRAPVVVLGDGERGEVARAARARSMATYTSTAMCLTAWNEPIGTPNWWRCRMWSSTRSKTRCEAPTIVAARPVSASSRARVDRGARRPGRRRPLGGHARRRRSATVGEVEAGVDRRLAGRRARRRPGTRNTPMPSSVAATTASSSARSPSRTCAGGAVEHPAVAVGAGRDVAGVEHGGARAAAGDRRRARRSRTVAVQRTRARAGGAGWWWPGTAWGRPPSPSSSSTTASSTAVAPLPPSLDGHGEAGPLEADERLPERVGVGVVLDDGAHERRRALALDHLAGDLLQRDLLVGQLEVHGLGPPRLSLDSKRSRLARSSGEVNERSSAVRAKSRVASTARSRCRLRMRLVSSDGLLRQLGDLLAQASAWSSTSSSGQTWLTRPISRGPLGRDAVAGEGVLLGQLQAGEQRPGDRPAVGGDEADEHVGVGEVGALGHEHDVGQGHEAAAEPDGRAVHGGDDRHPAGDHARSRSAGRATSVSLAQVGVLGELVDVVEVAAGGEGPAVAGEHGDPGVGVGVELREELGQALVQLVVGGVELVGPVEADDPDRAVGLDLDRRRAGRRS